jgi:hypothetical protein
MEQHAERSVTRDFDRLVERQYREDRQPHASVWHIFDLPCRDGEVPIGAKALCGHIKRLPPERRAWRSSDGLCAVCADLELAGLSAAN